MEPLYKRDPQAYHAYLVEGNAKQARKRVGADVLIRDGAGRILLVNPAYKPGWDLPGGMAEANESPATAARREIKEELGVDVEIGQLLVVDWVPPHGPWDDSLMFIFEGGTVAGTIVPVDDEIEETRFVSEVEASKMLRPYVWHRLRHALGPGSYIEHGQASGDSPASDGSF